MNATANILALAGIALLFWEALVLSERRTEATISWTTLSLSVAFPPIAFLWFVLTSHLFWPRCGVPGEMMVTPRVGALLSIGAAMVLIWEVSHRIRVPTIGRIQPAYFARLAVIALLGVAIGHYWLGQYVECGS